MKLTLEFLNKHNACSESVDFLTRNNLLGLDVDLEKVEGDYKGWIGWLKSLPTVSFDNNGNKIKDVYPNGDTCTYEYNDHGNMIKEVYPDGDTWTYVYIIEGHPIIIKENDQIILKI